MITLPELQKIHKEVMLRLRSNKQQSEMLMNQYFNNLESATQTIAVITKQP